jgi:hypothetical protein
LQIPLIKLDVREEIELNIEKLIPDQRVAPLKSLIPGKFPQAQNAALKDAQ